MKQKRGMRILSFVLSGLLSLGVIGNANLGVKRVEAATEVAINETNFHDEGFRNYVYEEFDLDKNWSLSSYEIGKVKQISYEKKNCSDLTGIEHFTALRRLYVAENNLTSLDLSNNKDLEDIKCEYNALKTLNISGLNKLDIISFDHNEIEHIELKGLDNLIILSCNSNQLKELDLSECPKLWKLYCTRNNLTSLDLTNLSRLDGISASYNSIQEIDLRPMDLLGKMANSWPIQVGYQENKIIDVYVPEDIYEEVKEVIYDKALGVQGLWLHKVPPIGITKQPVNITAKDGDGTQTFSVEAIGRGVSYQWYWRRNSADEWKVYGAEGPDAVNMKVGAIYERNGFQYCCEMKDLRGNVARSDIATLTVLPGKGVEITKQPTSQTAKFGNVTFSTAAVGSGLTYQWYWRKNASSQWSVTGFAGSKTAAMTVEAITARNGFQYRCEIKDKFGNVVYTDPATLNVPAMNRATVTKQPANQTAKTGNAVFTVGATGDGLTYQWYWRRNASYEWGIAGFTGAKTASMQVPVIAARNGFQYRCEVKDTYGNVVYSNPATLYYGSKATITKQPVNIKIAAGKTATFSLTAAGDGLTYQWYWRKNSSSEWGVCGFTGARTAAMQVPAIAARNGYQYQCVVKDKYGNSVTSSAVTFTVE